MSPPDAHARYILRGTSKHDTMINLRDDWQKKERKERE